jgi:hypothetical protein
VTAGVKSNALDLDHLGIAVTDLDQAARNFAALGFTLTDKSFHVASPAPGAEPVRTGTGNHCIMLAQGYVELIAITDPAYRGRLAADLARYEGLHLVSFGTASAEDTAALFQRTIGAAEAPRRLTRPILEQGKPVTALFDIVDLPEGIAAAGHVFAIRHLTRELLWQPHLTSHENGAVALLGVIACAADPLAFLAPIAAAIGGRVEENAIALEPGRFEAVDPQGLARRFPGAVPPSLPCYAGLTIGVRDLRALARLFGERGVGFRAVQNRLWVVPGLANGTIIEFREVP